MKRTRIASIDIGAAKVVTVMADTNGAGNLRILGFGMAVSQGIERGMIDSPRQTAVSVSQSIRKAEKMAGCRLKSACVSISDAHMNSVNSRGVISIPRSDQLVHVADRKRAFDVASSIELPGDQRLLHVIPRFYNLDGQDNIKNPVGMHGFRLNLETHIVTAPIESVQMLTRCVKSLGVGIEGLVLKSLASAEATLTEDEKQTGVLVADIGGEATDIAVFRNGSVDHTSTLPVGGYHITNDIALGLGIPFELAEVVKKKYGNIVMSEANDTGDTTVAENGCSVSYQELRDIISARIEELFRLILLQVQQADHAKVIPSGLVITGNTCNIDGIVELGHEVTQLPVRVGIPLNLGSDDDMLCYPAYATSIGLLYWKMRSNGLQGNRAMRDGLGVLLPRWLGQFARKGRQLNNQFKEKENGENKLRPQSSQN